MLLIIVSARSGKPKRSSMPIIGNSRINSDISVVGKRLSRNIDWTDIRYQPGD